MTDTIFVLLHFEIKRSNLLKVFCKMIWKVFRRYLANRHITANVDKSQFTNVPFQNGWNNLVKMYDLRMWYIQNSPHDAKCLTYVNDLERLHNELNYLNMRGTTRHNIPNINRHVKETYYHYCRFLWILSLLRTRKILGLVNLLIQVE